MEDILTNVVGNGAIGVILVWFMLQNKNLIAKLFDVVKASNDTIGRNTEVLNDVKEVIEEANGRKRR